MANDAFENRPIDAQASANGPGESEINDASLTETERNEIRRRRAMSTAVDDADASHEGGMGAQGGAVDFGNPKNFGLPR